MNLEEIIQDSVEFEKLMTTIDSDLKKKNVPIPNRVFGVIDYICKNFHLDILFTDTVAQKITIWFKQMYGERLKMDVSLGISLVDIRGDLYQVNFPLIYGACKINPLNLIQDCTLKLLHSLNQEERTDIVKHIMKHYEIYTTLGILRNVCISELKTAIDKILDRNPEYGLSRWASLQASEKAIKKFIRSKGIEPDKTHNINELSLKAYSMGLPHIEETVVNQVQCDAAVRYNEELSTKEQAYQSYCAALNICGLVTSNILPLR